MRKVAIVGSGPTAELAPFRDPSWEIWGLAWVQYPRETFTFDVHAPGFSLTSRHDDPEFVATVDAKGIPVYGVPGGPYKHLRPFPYDDVVKLSSGYLESSLAYLLTFAFLERVDRVALCGCNMNGKIEYCEQKPNFEYLIGLGRGMGIKVEPVPGSTLLGSVWEAGRYGVNRKHRFDLHRFTPKEKAA